MFMVLTSSQIHSLGSRDECRTAPDGDQADGLESQDMKLHVYPPSPFVLNQHESWYSIYMHVCALHRVSKKPCQCYFVNNSVKHWPNLIIFGMQHREET